MDDAGPQRMLLVGGDWCFREFFDEPRPHLRLRYQRQRSLLLASCEPLTFRADDTVTYTLRTWRTARGEYLQFYGFGDDDRCGKLFEPISETFDRLAVPLTIPVGRGRYAVDPLFTGFGPSRLFLAVGLYQLWREFNAAIERTGAGWKASKRRRRKLFRETRG